MWKPQNNRVIVELKGTQKKEIEIGGKTFILDSVFRRQFNAVQVATVIASGSDELIPGDKVYVHHFVIEDEKRVPVKEGDYRWLEFNQIYCRVRDGIIKTLGNYVLVKPIKYDESKFKKESDSGIILSTKAGTEYVDRVGEVAHVGPVAEAGGLEVGDKILFNKNCEYEIDIEGETLYRMEFRDVITVIDPEVQFTV